LEQSQRRVEARPDPLSDILASAHKRHLSRNEGDVPDYIPELARVEPEAFGIAIATVAGNVHSVGDADRPFTIQSVSKPFAYCLALELAGTERVSTRVGVEPSGDSFNSIVLDAATKRPFNPMINAGAITVTGILRDIAGAATFDLILDRLSGAAGRRLSVDEAVYRSEAETGHRNRAIGHLLRSVGVLEGSVDEVLDIYFRQCSILVTATDLARMGATLAQLGENPFTGGQVFDLASVRSTLSVMFTCGMYDYSGNWALDVGVPAKSGVGGGILGVVNRQLGIASYSPRLDAKGNSVRGVAAFREVGDELGLHAFECSNVGSAYLHALINP
jgi:glutaminase